MKLEARNITVRISGADILNGVDFCLPERGCIGIVGASGSGKTMFARSLMGLLPARAEIGGDYRIDGEDIDPNARERAWKKIRGRRIGLVMQDPFTSLDPLTRCGRQITAGLPPDRKRAFDLKKALDEVGLPPAVARQYPFELSGGMRQRVVIAAALATAPDILIADEATSALDVITQKGILDLADRIRQSRDMALIIITHDLGVVKSRTDMLYVFHKGNIVEAGPTGEVIDNPRDTYTKALLRAASGDGADTGANRGTGDGKKNVLMAVTNLSKRFGERTAVDRVSLRVNTRECVGIVGESGSGKTTLARCIVGLADYDEGEIVFGSRGSETRASAKDARKKRFDAQIVFQDPYSSLNPALTVREILTEALWAAGQPPSDLDELLELTELSRDFLSRRPGRLSGGQRQRVALARALAPRPRLLICDEAVSALDVLVQEQILHTLRELRDGRDLSILFITHDLGVCRRIADRVYVMYNSRIVEEGDTDRLFESPRHPYTKELTDAARRL
jgi:peptide/nickel transport system ATP-binding protein